MTGLLAAICLLLPPLQDEESKTDPARHIRVAQLYLGHGEKNDRALRHLERAWEMGNQLKPETRLDLLGMMAELRPKVPPPDDGREANEWKVLGVVFRGVNWAPGNMARGRLRPAVQYRLSGKVVSSLRKGFETAMDRFQEASRGSLKITRKFQIVPEDLRELYWWNQWAGVSPEGYAKTRGPKWRPGDWDLVLVYLVGGPDEKNSIPMDANGEYKENVEGAEYLNYLMAPEEVMRNGETGGRELTTLAWRLRGLIVHHARYPDILIPEPKDESIRQDPDFESKLSRDIMTDFILHLLNVHVTAQMWRDAKKVRLAAPFIREWRISERFHFEKHDGYDKEYVEESDPDLDTRRWKIVKSPQDHVDLGALHTGRTHNTVVYLATCITARESGPMRVYLGHDDGVKVFVNGRLVFLRDKHWKCFPDENVARFEVKEGRNLLLVKIENMGGYWGVCVRVTGPEGDLPKGVSVSPAGR